jgi:hypothetical protein
VGTEGVEPSRIAPQVPKTCASAISPRPTASESHPHSALTLIAARFTAEWLYNGCMVVAENEPCRTGAACLFSTAVYAPGRAVRR